MPRKAKSNDFQYEVIEADPLTEDEINAVAHMIAEMIIRHIEKEAADHSQSHPDTKESA